MTAPSEGTWPVFTYGETWCACPETNWEWRPGRAEDYGAKPKWIGKLVSMDTIAGIIVIGNADAPDRV